MSITSHQNKGVLVIEVLIKTTKRLKYMYRLFYFILDLKKIHYNQIKHKKPLYLY